jgi:hypothetical protein
LIATASKLGQRLPNFCNWVFSAFLVDLVWVINPKIVVFLVDECNSRVKV